MSLKLSMRVLQRSTMRRRIFSQWAKSYEPSNTRLASLMASNMDSCFLRSSVIDCLVGSYLARLDLMTASQSIEVADRRLSTISSPSLVRFNVSSSDVSCFESALRPSMPISRACAASAGSVVSMSSMRDSTWGAWATASAIVSPRRFSSSSDSMFRSRSSVPFATMMLLAYDSMFAAYRVASGACRHSSRSLEIETFISAS
mmetsp:Transcript_4906/g.14215  ORF Transcript_4906/g.14215 Transcript_4906/m.14215 type:complete len:202 (-) Transcript_4906:1536-2141(-)